MWQADSAYYIVIGAHRVQCGRQQRGQWVVESLSEQSIAPSEKGAVLANVANAVEAAVDSLLQHAPELNSPAAGKRNLHVLVADQWLSLADIPWSPALISAGTSESFARMHLSAGGFDVDEHDVLRLDDAAYGQQRVAVAFSHDLLHVLALAAERSEAGLVSIMPLSAVAWEWTRHQHGRSIELVAIVEGCSATFLRMLHGRMSLQAHVNLPIADASARNVEITSAIQRMRLRDPTLANTRVHVFEPFRRTPEGSENQTIVWVSGPGHITPTRLAPELSLAAWGASLSSPLDAVEHRQSMTLRQGLLTSAVGALALMAVLYAAGTHSEASRAAQEFAAAKNSLRPASVKTIGRDEQGRIRAVNGAVRQLNMPVSSLLHAMQPPRGMHVALLGIDMIPVLAGGHSAAEEGSAIRVTAEANSSEEMVAYVSFLAQRPPFVMAYLAQHELAEAHKESPYRFTVEATWRE